MSGARGCSAAVAGVYLLSMRIGAILARKPIRDVVTIRPDAAVRELLAVLAEHNIGACIVSGDGATVEGIVSERDVVRRLEADPSALEHPVAGIMTRAVTTCTEDDTVDGVMAVMTEHRIRHVPVVDDTTLVGIISIGDLVKHRIDELTFERDQLDHYLHQA